MWRHTFGAFSFYHSSPLLSFVQVAAAAAAFEQAAIIDSRMTAVNELTESDATQASKVSVDGGPEHLQLVHTVETLHASAWLSLAKLHYRQPHTGVSLPWEVVRRVPPQCATTSTTTSAVADAVSTGRWPGLTMDGNNRIDMSPINGRNTSMLTL